MKATFLVLALVSALFLAGCGSQTVTDQSATQAPTQPEMKQDTESGNQMSGAAATSSE